jgi:pimeloyl-ACP methyl ester carboxylesterase
VVAPDLRGFGLSESIGAGGYYHFPDYVADLAELVDTLAPRRLALVGHSMGGVVATLYAGTRAGTVERLALLEGMGPLATTPSLAIDRMQAWLRDLRAIPRTPKVLTSLQEAIERLVLHHPRVPREIIESRAKLLTRVDDTGKLLWAYDPLHRTTSPTPFSTDTFREFLTRIDCPTLVVSGGPTGWRPPDEAERIASLRHAVTHDFPSAGHMMHWTEPKALADRLLAFLAEPLPARPAGASRPGITAPPGSGGASAAPGSGGVSAAAESGGVSAAAESGGVSAALPSPMSAGRPVGTIPRTRISGDEPDERGGAGAG